MLSVIRVSALLALAALMLLAPGAEAKKSPASAGPPADYTQTQRLSQPSFETVRDVVRLPAYDGEELYIEITRPDAPGRFPVILEASPYHGTLADRDGTRILPEPRDADGKSLGLTRYFAPRGYAVVMMDLRGTGRSQGCLDHLGPKDGRDLEQTVEWAAGQAWSNGRVGMTGHSYVGSTPSVAAAQRPDGLATIVPSAGLASMYHHQFQGGRALLPPVGRSDRGLRADRHRAQAAGRRRLRQQHGGHRLRASELGCRRRRGPALGPLLGLASGARLGAGRDQRGHPGLPRARRERQRRPRAGDGLVHPPRRTHGRQALARPVGPRLRLLSRPGAASSGPTRCTPGSTASSRSAR